MLNVGDVIALQVVDEPAEVHCAVVGIATRSKLSCLSWNKYTKNFIASSDYEGIVTVWDVSTRQVMPVIIFYSISSKILVNLCYICQFSV